MSGHTILYIMPISDTSGGNLISAGASVLNNLISMPFNAAQNRKAFQQQKWLQNNAQDFQRSMWNAANEYNTPSAQLSRLTQAGINPNSAFAGVEGTAQGAAPPSGAGQGSAPAPAYMGYSSFNPSPDILASIRKMNAEADEAGAAAAGQKIDNAWKDRLNAMSIKEAESRVKANEAQVRSYCASAELDKVQADQVLKLTPILLTKGEQEVEELKAITEKYHKEVEQADAEIKLAEEKLRTERSAQAANYASAEASEASAALSRESTETQKQETTKSAAQAAIEQSRKKKETAKNEFESKLYANGIPADKININNPFSMIYTSIAISKTLRKNDGKKNRHSINDRRMPSLR